VLFTNFEDRIALIRVFPGMKWELYTSLFDFEKVKGIVIETFGAGNVASDPIMKELVKRFIQNGGVILNVTQCATGIVEQGKYETSSFFNKIGVISGHDLTTESAVTKLMFVLGKEKTKSDLETILHESLAGELTIK
jgi:L-asparaginase